MKVVDLEAERNERKEPCPYCGAEAHAAPLACPRVSGITVYKDNDCCDIQFWPPDDGPVAA